jgi:hypothetical protein
VCVGFGALDDGKVRPDYDFRYFRRMSCFYYNKCESGPDITKTRASFTPELRPLTVATHPERPMEYPLAVSAG